VRVKSKNLRLGEKKWQKNCLFLAEFATFFFLEKNLSMRYNGHKEGKQKRFFMKINVSNSKWVFWGFLMIILVAALCGCGGSGNDSSLRGLDIDEGVTSGLDVDEDVSTGTFEGLSLETEIQIKQTIIDNRPEPWRSNSKIDNVIIRHYFGTYNGCVAFLLGGLPFGPMENNEDIIGLTFKYPSAQKISVWKENNIYSLQEAYEKMYLTLEDIIIINGKHRDAFPMLYGNWEEYPDFETGNWICKYCERMTDHVDREFKYDEISVVLTKTAASLDKEWTLADFSGFAFSRIEDGVYINDVYYKYSGMFFLHLAEPSRENVLKAIYYLNQRPEILCAELRYLDVFPKSGPPVNIFGTDEPELATDDDFVLTISVEETTIRQGENFRVNYELKNNSGDDHYIIYAGIYPIIPEVKNHGGMIVGFPYLPATIHFRANSLLELDYISGVFGSPWQFGWPLKPGVYELKFRATFFLNWEQENQRAVGVDSNTIMITVQ